MIRLRVPTACLLAIAALAIASPAFAELPTVSPTPSNASASIKPAQGVAVLGLAGARDDAFALGHAVYTTRLRPASLDDARAKILAGESARDDAPKELKDLAETRAAITGLDGPSKRLLASLAKELTVEAILVVSEEPSLLTDPSSGMPAAPIPIARIFLADTGEVDAARYLQEPDASGPLAWRATVSSIERRVKARYASEIAGAPTNAAPIAATHPLPPKQEQKPFYSEPFFWGAIGAAVLVGGGFFLLSRDTSTSTLHLNMTVPK